MTGGKEIKGMYRVYDYDNDCIIGYYDDYEEAEICCNEYISNYGEPVEVMVESLNW